MWWAKKKENRGLKNIVTEGKKKDTDICIMKGMRYRGRGKYLVLEKPTSHYRSLRQPPSP